MNEKAADAARYDTAQIGFSIAPKPQAAMGQYCDNSCLIAGIARKNNSGDHIRTKNQKNTKKEPVAQRQEMVIGTLALLLYFLMVAV